MAVWVDLVQPRQNLRRVLESQPDREAWRLLGRDLPIWTLPLPQSDRAVRTSLRATVTECRIFTLNNFSVGVGLFRRTSRFHVLWPTTCSHSHSTVNEEKCGVPYGSDVLRKPACRTGGVVPANARWRRSAVYR